jgi:hypothetical protein
MKGTISDVMRKLINNRPLYEKFLANLTSPRKEFYITDEDGNIFHYTPYPIKSKPKRKRNLLQILLGL